MNDGMPSLPRGDGRNPSRPWATAGQAADGVNAGVVLSAASGRNARLAWLDYPIALSASTGSGGSTNSGFFGTQLSSGTTAFGEAVAYGNYGSGAISLWSIGQVGAGVIDWRRRRAVCLRVLREAGNNSLHRLYIQYGQTPNGMTSYNGTVGRGIRCEVRNNRFWLLVNNGTTTTSVDSGVDYITGGVDIVIESDGIGNAFLFVDGRQIATCTGAPTTLAANSDTIHVGVSNGGSTENTAWLYFAPRFLWS